MPPITVPAWASMVTGCTPGQLGLYGFRGRADYGYSARLQPSSLSFNQPTLWEHLSQRGFRCVVVGVPLSWPAKPVRGALVAGFPCPNRDRYFTYPPELAQELPESRYTIDVEHRGADRDPEFFPRLVEMTCQRFTCARELLTRDRWDFFMMVEMGPDRLHHVAWDHGDVVGDYYAELDRHLGSLLDLLGPGDLVMVVSDHGAQDNLGTFSLNRWLREQGLLVLGGQAEGRGAIGEIDWSATRAWADGGYVGRIYFNIKGREPHGIVPPAQAPQLAGQIKAALAAVQHPKNADFTISAHTPQELYGDEPRGIPPDLTVVVSDLAYRVSGEMNATEVFGPTLQSTLQSAKNSAKNLGGANHAMMGTIVTNWTTTRPSANSVDILDIAPTVLAAFGLPSLPGQSGRVF